MRKTTPEEIERLYAFTREHYVEYYDVQTELVDHLASAMDENWEREPELSFEENLQREFRKFGVFGFSEVVKEKASALEKRYFKLIWQEIKSQVVQPQGFFVLGSLFVGILFLLIFGSIEVNAFFTLIYFVLVFFYLLKTSRKLKRKKKQGERIYLLEFFILNAGQYFTLFYLPFQIIYFSDILKSELWETKLWLPFLVALVFTLMIYASYICLYLFPKKRDEILQKQYPELKFHK